MDKLKSGITHDICIKPLSCFSVRHNDFSGFHVNICLKILFLRKERWDACGKHALQQSVVLLCP